MLLNSPQFTEQLFESISNCNSSFLTCSAFIKTRALKDKRFTSFLEDKNVVVVARWRKHDLVAGASDLDVYDLCKNKGWKFGIDLNLHGKLFLVDERDIFLGSANLTQKGLHIGLTGNHEFGTRISVEQADLNKIQSFISSEVTWMNDELYQMIASEVGTSKATRDPIESTSWSQAIEKMVRRPVEYLWVQELVFTTPSMLLAMDFDDERALHDFDLLGLNIDDINVAALKRGFRRTRLFRWLCSILNEKSLSFGGVTACLHSSILDDPKPYRIDIKSYNQILFQWAEFLNDTFELSQPNYSQVISLK